jgi:hypothetical protein
MFSMDLYTQPKKKKEPLKPVNPFRSQTFAESLVDHPTIPQKAPTRGWWENESEFQESAKEFYADKE